MRHGVIDCAYLIWQAQVHMFVCGMLAPRDCCMRISNDHILGGQRMECKGLRSYMQGVVTYLEACCTMTDLSVQGCTFDGRGVGLSVRKWVDKTLKNLDECGATLRLY